MIVRTGFLRRWRVQPAGGQACRHQQAYRRHIQAYEAMRSGSKGAVESIQ